MILSENTGLNETLVKRVIALEGQTVDIDEDGYVLVDGERYADARESPPSRKIGGAIWTTR